MALVQKSAKLSASGQSLPRTFTNAFPSMPTPGNDVIAVVAIYGPVPSSVTIAGTVATLDGNHSPSDQYRQLIYRARVGATPNRNMVIAGSGSVWVTAAVMEVTPLASPPVDQYATDFEWLGPTDPVTIETPGPTSQANELVIATWTSFSEQSSNLQGSAPASPGYTTLWTEQNHIDYMGGNASYKFVTTTGVQTAQWTRNITDRALTQIITYRVQASEPVPEHYEGDTSVTHTHGVAAAGRKSASGVGGATVSVSLYLTGGSARVGGIAVAAGHALAVSGGSARAGGLAVPAGHALTASGASGRLGATSVTAGHASATTGRSVRFGGVSAGAGHGVSASGRGGRSGTVREGATATTATAGASHRTGGTEVAHEAATAVSGGSSRTGAVSVGAVSGVAVSGRPGVGGMVVAAVTHAVSVSGRARRHSPAGVEAGHALVLSGSGHRAGQLAVEVSSTVTLTGESPKERRVKVEATSAVRVSGRKGAVGEATLPGVQSIALAAGHKHATDGTGAGAGHAVALSGGRRQRGALQVGASTEARLSGRRRSRGWTSVAHGALVVAMGRRAGIGSLHVTVPHTVQVHGVATGAVMLRHVVAVTATAQRVHRVDCRADRRIQITAG